LYVAEQHMQKHTTCTPEDGHIDARNMQRYLRPPTKLKEIQITLNLNPNLNNKGNTRRRP